MPVDLKGKSFLTLKDFNEEEIKYLLELSQKLKEKKRLGIKNKVLEGKNIVLLFEKSSTRTRCAFETAIYDEGGHVTFLGMQDSQFGKKESVEDSAKVLGRFYDAIEFRGYSQKTVEDLHKYSRVPVYNGLTDIDHPTQVLADFLTLKENFSKPYNKMKLTFVGDTRNNIANALAIIAAKLGSELRLLGPKELHPLKEFLDSMQEIAKKSGAKIIVTDNIDEGVNGVDAIYTDVWVSMGEEDKIQEKILLLSPYKVTRQMFEKTNNKEAIFLHCLPAFHDFETVTAKKMENLGFDIREVENEVFRSSCSKVFDEAENRLHTIKAVIVATLV